MILHFLDSSYVSQDTHETFIHACLDQDLHLGPGERAVINTGVITETAPNERLLLFPAEQLLVEDGCLVQLIWPPKGELQVLIIHVGDKPQTVTISSGRALGTLVGVLMPG
jgi:dUTPase